MQEIQRLCIAFGDLAWGPWLVVLILGSGLYFLALSRFLPFRYLGHSIQLLRGKYDDESSPGDITHFQALASALSGTIGMGNIAGVAVAIHMGGPGAIFWMWATAVVGIATKFFTCTLAIMYRGPDSEGHIQGGPMYVIREGLGRRWRPLAVFFSGVGVIGCLPLFQTNQLVQTVRDVIFVGEGWLDPGHAFEFNVIAGLVLAAIVAVVIFGGLQRIAAVASRLVPGMALFYVITAIYVLGSHASEVPGYLAMIVKDAFGGSAVAGGALGTVIVTGVRRGVFSNEAGIGTESMAHGAAKTDEPVREGLVAMMGPIIDTLVICTATALIILISGAWKTGEGNGVTLTAQAFEATMPGVGIYILIIAVICFSTSTIFGYSYYGSKCLGYLIGADKQHFYNYIIVVSTVIAAILSLDAMVGVVDGTFALMAIPTTTSALALSPKVMSAARKYFAELKHMEIATEPS
ncbi:MAG TPA: alanine/glycine:cation symporter family protein [Pseudomonadales bacterium]|nr:alanine/glycine:cation symporter family protein [Pseudomonadales bacterium]